MHGMAQSRRPPLSRCGDLASVAANQASATHEVTTWDPATVASVDLGAAARTWHLAYRDTDPYPNVQGPGVVVVYTRPDGVRDFTFTGPVGTFPGNDAGDTFQASGRVYAFFLLPAQESPTASAFDLTFTSED